MARYHKQSPGFPYGYSLSMKCLSMWGRDEHCHNAAWPDGGHLQMIDGNVNGKSISYQPLGGLYCFTLCNRYMIAVGILERPLLYWRVHVQANDSSNAGSICFQNVEKQNGKTQ